MYFPNEAKPEQTRVAMEINQYKWRRERLASEKFGNVCKCGSDVSDLL